MSDASYYVRHVGGPEYRASRARKAELVYAMCAEHLAAGGRIVDLGAGTGIITRALEALSALTPAPDEIVLVDNGSTDDTPDQLRAFAAAAAARVVVHREPRRGASVARNTGVRAATGDIVAFTDADCCPRADWLAALVEPLADSGVGAAAGRNPLSIVAPCYRVVGIRGELTGFAGGLEVKARLLAFERAG